MKSIWKNTIGSIITALVIYTLAGLAGSIIDAVSNIGTDIMGYIWDIAMAAEGDMDFFKPDASDIAGIIANVLVVIGCIMLLSSLSQFKELQKSEDAKLNIGKVHSGYIILILAVLIDFIPIVGGLFAFILYIVGNAKQISGYKNLSKSESLPEYTRQGFDTLRLCVVWILIGDIIGIIPFIGDIIESIISFFVFFGIISGWRTVRDNEPEGSFVPSLNINNKTPNNVRLYDDAKLAEIAGSEGIYNSQLVQQCRHEIEVRNKSNVLYEKIKELDDNRINEIIENSGAYSEEFVYGCERERSLREEVRKQNERIRWEKEYEEKRERRSKWWKKWGALVIMLIIAASGTALYGVYCHYENQQRIAEEMRIQAQHEFERQEAERLEQIRLAEEKRIEQIRLAEEKKKAEAEAQKQAEIRRQEEARLAVEAEEKRLIEGPFEIGEYHTPTKGVIIYLDGTKKHGVAMTLQYKSGRDTTWLKNLGTGWRFPTPEEISYIWENSSEINKTINKKAGRSNEYRHYNGKYLVHFHSSDGNAYAYNQKSSSSGYTRLVKDF